MLAVAFAFLNLRSQKQEVEEEEAPEVSQEQRPFTSLTPGAFNSCRPASPDGTWLRLEIEGIKFPALEYTILYQPAVGPQQGVPSSLIDLAGEDFLTRDILLGSESRGHCKYDQGVEFGSLTLKFRNLDGKFLGRLETRWHLQTKDTKLTSADGKFSLSLRSIPPGFFLTMDTFGLPSPAPGEVLAGPYGVFASQATDVSGTVEFEQEGKIYLWDGSSWEKLGEGQTSSLGVFILMAQ